jgi:hypothetical protein
VTASLAMRSWGSPLSHGYERQGEHGLVHPTGLGEMPTPWHLNGEGTDVRQPFGRGEEAATEEGLGDPCVLDMKEVR